MGLGHKCWFWADDWIKGGKTLNRIEFLKSNKWGLILPLVILIITLLYRNQLYGVFGEENYVVIHLMMEIFIIVGSFTISIQAWLIFPYTLSSYRLNIGALFLALGLSRSSPCTFLCRYALFY